MFLFVPYYSDIATNATQQSILKVVLQNFLSVQTYLLLLDKHLLQTCE